MDDVGSDTAPYGEGNGLSLIVALSSPAADAGVPPDSGAVARALLERAAARHGAPALFALDAEPTLDAGRLLLLSAPADEDGDVLASAMALISTVHAMVADAVAIYWPPAHLWSRFERGFADATVADMDREGIPPVMHLVDFAVVHEGATLTVSTRGLAIFAGSELRLSGPSPLSARDGLRAAARLAIDAMLQRGPAGPMIVDGLNMGERLRLGAAIVEDGGRVIPVEWIPPGH
jgi:hypothetical protein